MIFQRVLQSELINVAGAVFTTLFTVTITVMLIRILGQAAGGSVGSADVAQLIGYTVMTYLPVLLILTGFITVLLVISRSYQDSEMVIWFSSGKSLLAWVAPIIRFVLPLVILIGALSFWGTPWANRQSAELKERFQKREDIAKVSPGRFQESAVANRIFFVEGLSEDLNKVKNIFVSTSKDNKVSIVVAKEGTIESTANGDKLLVMKQGRRYDLPIDGGDFLLMEFDRYGLHTSSARANDVGKGGARSLPTSELINDFSTANRAELLWRISLPCMGLLLTLLAIPLSFINPRAGRSINLIIAILLFVTYSNTVSIFQAWVMQGKYTFGMAWWPTHVIALILTCILFSWRLNVNSRWHPLTVWSTIKQTNFLRQG